MNAWIPGIQMWTTHSNELRRYIKYKDSKTLQPQLFCIRNAKRRRGGIAAPKFCNPEMMNISRYMSRCRFSSPQRTYRRCSLSPLLWTKTNHKSLLNLLNHTFEGGVLTSTLHFFWFLSSSLGSCSAPQCRRLCSRRKRGSRLCPSRCALWRKPTATWGRRWRPSNGSCVRPNGTQPKNSRLLTWSSSTSPTHPRLTPIRTPLTRP